MNLELITKYLSDLNANNNREWYHAHKDDYKVAYEEFLILIKELIVEIGKFDPSILNNDPDKLTFKLVRDTRFSHDKSPYNPAFRAHISSKGKLPVPVGYFIVIKPEDQSFLGGGLFADMFKDATTMVRDYICDNQDEWNSIINSKDFVQNFTVKGTALKNVPNGYDKTLPVAEYFKNKSWYLEYMISDKELINADKFVEKSVDIFRKMKLFNDYIYKALVNFTMPQRP